MAPRTENCKPDPYGVDVWLNIDGFFEMNYHDHIARDPEICGGEPVIRGTRVTLRTVLASLAEGSEEAEILEDFPALTREDLKAVIAFAATSAEEDLPVPETPRFDDADPAGREPAAAPDRRASRARP
jgi:uncharacterized protein (DUF433 family)